MAHRHFCTYFDHRYLARGLALHDSLAATCGEFTLWVLALSVEAERLLESIKPPNVRVIPLQALLAHDRELAAARPTRSLVEFYFTCSPCLPRYVLQTAPGIDAVTYLDSDLFFFASPEQVFREIGPASVAITPHRLAGRAARTHARFGRYNVGWLTFRNDTHGTACLDWWRDRCIEWCHDWPEPHRYADQKYLDQFEERFEGVHVIRHPGANLAPWNVGGVHVAPAGDSVSVDGESLVFFHFQGLRRLGRHWYDSTLGGYGARLSPLLRERVFRPYIASLENAERRVAAAAPALAAGAGPGVRRRAGVAGMRAAAGRALRTLRAAVHGNLVHH